MNRQPTIRCTLCGDHAKTSDLLPVQLRHPTQLEYMPTVHFACQSCRDTRKKKWRAATWSATKLGADDCTVYASMLSTRVITVREPFAWLLVNGYKDCENRSQNFSFTGRILIHAAKQPMDGFDDLCRRLFDQHGVSIPPLERLTLGAITGVCHFGKMTMSRENLFWFIGPHAWPVEWSRQFAAPVPMPGKLGLWRVSDQLPIKL